MGVEVNTKGSEGTQRTCDLVMPLSKRERVKLLEELARTDSARDRERVRRVLRRNSIFDWESTIDGAHIPDLSDEKLVERYLRACEADEPYERSRLGRELDRRGFDQFALANASTSWLLHLEDDDLNLDIFRE